MPAQAVQLPQGAVLRQGMPGRERQVLTELSPFLAREILAGNGNRRQGHERGILFRPGFGRIIQGHPIRVRALDLHLEYETGPRPAHFFAQLIPQKISPGILIDDRFPRSACVTGARCELDVVGSQLVGRNAEIHGVEYARGWR